MDEGTILEDSVNLFGDERNDDSTIRYGHISISIPAKAFNSYMLVTQSSDALLDQEGKACVLLADQLFSPSFALTEILEQGKVPYSGKCWIELGAGSGLVSIAAAASKQPPASVVITDYPDNFILDNLKANVVTNRGLFSKECNVRVEGYAWGSAVDHLLTGPASSGFDLIVMSDLLYFDKSHNKLIESVELLLAKTKEARLWVAAGKYTPKYVCDSFLEQGTKIGLFWEEMSTSGNWEGDTTTGTYTVEELQLRKHNSDLWFGRWNDEHT